MNRQKAIEQARRWVNQGKVPTDISDSDARNVLKGCGFTLVGESSAHTSFRWTHPCLDLDPERYTSRIVKYAISHTKGQKKVLLKRSACELRRSLALFLDYLEVHDG